jgi:hypothetical protein
MRLVKGCYNSHLLIEEIDFSQFDASETML